jgi:transposase
MTEAGRPKAPLTLADGERAVLERWARRPRSAQALRSKIVLACAEGTANKEVAARLGVTPQMVGKWRARFVAARLDGLADEPRPGQPRKITDEQVEEVIVKTLEDKPPNQDPHWSTRSMAKATGLNQTAVSRIWQAFGLKPHVQETWKLSADPQSIEKVRDIVGLYTNPPDPYRPHRRAHEPAPPGFVAGVLERVP